METCPRKTREFNNSKYKDYLLNLKFICSNCGTLQLIVDNYLFSGYCDKNQDSSHGGCFYYGTPQNYLNNFDEIAFICSNQECGKMSINKLSGNPFYNIAKLGSNELIVLSILKEQKEEILLNLIKEYYFALILKHNSAATLLARKILMHFAFILGCEEKNKKFIEYVDYIQQDGTLGKKWNKKIDLIRTLGNEENHKLKIASNEELEVIKILMSELINSHFKPDML